MYVDYVFRDHLRLLISTYLQADLSTTELIFTILNFVFCIPVIVMVGMFRCVYAHTRSPISPSHATIPSLYHFYCVATNTTTIEAWEKDKVATLIRRGKIREVRNAVVFDVSLGTEVVQTFSPGEISICTSEVLSVLLYPILTFVTVSAPGHNEEHPVHHWLQSFCILLASEQREWDRLRVSCCRGHW